MDNNNNKIRSILQDALETEIPPSQVNLWPAVKARLVGGKMNTAKSHHRPRLAFATLAIVALLTIAFATPQGRAFAQSVFQLFTRAEGTTFPLRPSQIVTREPGAPAPTAAPPSPLISVAEAEAQAGFDAAELPSVPEGLNYLGARLYGNAINIEYETQGRSGHLSIMQSKEGFVQSNWDRVPAGAVVPVKIGDLDGEYAQGRFVVYAGETSATWAPDASILRLRWVENGVWFEMTKTGNAPAIDYLDRAVMIELAESLSVKP